MHSEEYQLQVIIASGNEQIEKALLGFAFALAAASTGSRVVLFFTMNGAQWTDEALGQEHIVNGFETINTYWDLLTELDAVFEGCTACVENYCHSKDNKCTLRKNMVLAGLSTASIRALSVPTVVF
jgi:predicted peroxiredoxin